MNLELGTNTWGYVEEYQKQAFLAKAHGKNHSTHFLCSLLGQAEMFTWSIIVHKCVYVFLQEIITTLRSINIKRKPEATALAHPENA